MKVEILNQQNIKKYLTGADYLSVLVSKEYNSLKGYIIRKDQGGNQDPVGFTMKIIYKNDGIFVDSFVVSRHSAEYPANMFDRFNS